MIGFILRWVHIEYRVHILIMFCFPLCKISRSHVWYLRDRKKMIEYTFLFRYQFLLFWTISIRCLLPPPETPLLILITSWHPTNMFIYIRTTVIIDILFLTIQTSKKTSLAEHDIVTNVWRRLINIICTLLIANDS